MSNEQKYNVTVGLKIVKAESPSYADFGLVYSGLKYADVVQIEEAMAKHADAINKAMGPLIADLVAMGYEKAATKGANK